MRRPRAFFLCTVFMTLSLFFLPDGAQRTTVEAADPSPGPQQTASENHWKESKGFLKNQTSFGLALGAGFGSKVLGTSASHDLAEGLLRFGWVFSRVMARDRWYGGNWELVGELFGGSQFNPNVRYFVGITPLLRYTLASRPWAPFLNGGAGLSATDIGGPDLSTTFEFNVQFGGGVHYFLRPKMAATLDYRWLHFSNAGIRSGNLGTNTQMFLIGLNWFY